MLTSVSYSANLTCPNCDSVLVRKFGILEMTIVAPLLALSVALAYWDAEPLGFVLFVVSLASAGQVS
jgi:hypothetical protein